MNFAFVYIPYYFIPFLCFPSLFISFCFSFCSLRLSVRKATAPLTKWKVSIEPIHSAQDSIELKCPGFNRTKLKCPGFNRPHIQCPGFSRTQLHVKCPELQTISGCVVLRCSCRRMAWTWMISCHRWENLDATRSCWCGLCACLLAYRVAFVPLTSSSWLMSPITGAMCLSLWTCPG